MSSFPLVYVVTITYNHCEDVVRTLDSLSRMAYPNYRLLVVDNQSTDGVVEIVRDGYPDVELLVNPSNLGFAAGVNRGLRFALDHEADCVLVVNSDVMADPSMLMQLVSAIEPGVGATAPVIHYLDHPEKIWSIGFVKHPLLLEMRGGARGQVDQGQWQKPFEVDYLLGCAILLSSTMLRDIGFFDEHFFFFYEDLDLSLRARRRGYRLVTVPQARLWHKVAGSSEPGSTFRAYHQARSSVLFFRMHTRGIQKPASFLFRFASALQISLKFLLHRQFHLLRHYWLGLWDGWQAS